MAGSFRKVDVAPVQVGDGSQKYDVYEWSPGRAKSHEAFKIRFLSPDQESGPRGFFVELLLRLWVDGQSTCFLEKACAYGYKVLTELDPLSASDKDTYQLCKFLFRNRNEGHMRVGREFNSAIDFLDSSTKGSPALITPGLDSTEEGKVRGADTIHDTANRLLSDALREGGKAPLRKHSNFQDVLAWYEAQVEDQQLRGHHDGPGASHFVPWTTLPGRSDFDLFITDGLTRNSTRWDGIRASTKVRSALIDGAVLIHDQEKALKDPERFKSFVRKMWKQVNSRSLCEFDSWLKNTRAHGFLSLVGGTRLSGDAREEASLQAQRFYCMLMWMAYERMARCYGALMFLVHMDFCLHGEREPTIEERRLFRRWHFPQLYLAGLPQDFLGKPQLRWIIRGLGKLWNNSVVESEQYDMITELLGIYGVLQSNRREADNRRKAAAGKYTIATEPQHLADMAIAKEEAEEVESVADLARGAASSGTNVVRHTGRQNDPKQMENEGQQPVQELFSINCPECGNELQRVDRLDLSGLSCARILFYCSGCEKKREYKVDLDRLRQS